MTKGKGSAEAAKGPDNNKRLAELEAGVSALTLALTEGGRSLEGNDVFSIAIAELKEYAAVEPHLASLEGAVAGVIGSAVGESFVEEAVKLLNVHERAIKDLADMGAAAAQRSGNEGALIEVYRSGVSDLAAAMVGAGIDVPNDADVISIAVAHFAAAEEAAANATPGEIAAIARAEKAEARVAELEALFEDAADAALAKAAGDAEPTEPSAPRDAVECGEAYGNLSAADLNLRMEEGAKFELVFSDGDNEILEFERVPINAVGGLVRHGSRYMIDPVILINGPRTEGAVPIEIAGAALLADGEQVGFCGFDRPLVVNPGDQRQFARTFLFG